MEPDLKLKLQNLEASGLNWDNIWGKKFCRNLSRQDVKGSRFLGKSD